ncbi:MAG TPA: sigma-54 dependent transcriptional regulator [Candidatus Angelobacter sp.]|nr:sigma-54 dependent transcriptional regulator [Candidatus Angelobacter sp.]
MIKAKILIVDDDPTTQRLLSRHVESLGHSVVTAADLESACQELESNTPDVAIVDVGLPDGDGVQFLAEVKNRCLWTETIILTADGSIENAVRSIKQGANQFRTKPLDFRTLSSDLANCLEHNRNKRKQLCRKLTISRHERNPFLGTSRAIRRLEQETRRIISTERPILIQGETGSGKGVLAQWIYKNGPRSEEEIVDVNCAGLSKDLLESELFGYNKGAFTGASSGKPGLVEVAHCGILFLDELGEMDIMVQPKLLRILENKRFRRLGDLRERTADIQVIAATNRNLMRWVKEMRFREDLYFRISTFQLRIPPLRERAEDIPILADNILHELAEEMGCDKKELSNESKAMLKTYSWPGNIRELRNALERAVLTCDTLTIGTEDLGVLDAGTGDAPCPAEGGPTWEAGAAERNLICSALEVEGGNVAHAALRLRIPRSTLYKKIRRYSIDLQDSQTSTHSLRC